MPLVRLGNPLERVVNAQTASAFTSLIVHGCVQRIIAERI